MVREAGEEKERSSKGKELSRRNRWKLHVLLFLTLCHDVTTDLELASLEELLSRDCYQR